MEVCSILSQMEQTQKKTKYLIIDTETGGTQAGAVSLLSLCLLALDDTFNVTGQLNLMVMPDDGVFRITAGSLKINKIDIIEHAKLAILTSAAKDLFIEFLENHSYGKTNRLTIIGHNPSFDISFLMKEFNIPEQEWGEYFEYKLIDTATVALFLQHCNLLPSTLSCKLTSLATHFEIDITNAHSAEADVMICYCVYLKLLDIVQRSVICLP